MKRILLFSLAALLIAAPAGAVEYYEANQRTIAWDAATLSSGEPIPETDQVKYVVFVKNTATGEETPAADPITETQITLSFRLEGFYIVGVKAQRFAPDPDNAGAFMMVAETTFTWSDSNDPVAVPAGPFGIKNFSPLNKVFGLRTLYND